MNLYKLIYALLVVGLFGCSSDSDPVNPGPSNLILPDITTLYIDQNDDLVLQEVLNNGEDLILSNLTQELGVPFDYLFSRLDGSTLSFYDKSPENYGIFERNLISGASNSISNVCDPSTGGISVIAGRSENKYVLITDSENPDEIFLRIMDKQSGDCIISSLGDGIIPGFNAAAIMGESLFFFKVVGGAQPILMKINLQNGQTEQQLFINEFRTITIDGNRLCVLFPDNSIQIFDTQNLVLSDSGNLGSNFFDYSFGFDPGRVSGNEFFIEIPLPQPSLYSSSPAVVDMASGNIIKGGQQLIFDIRDNLEAELGESVELLSFDVDLQPGHLVYAFSVGSTAQIGLLFTNFDAEILKITDLDERPYEVMIR